MTPEQRHKAMAHARGRTRPELALASALWRRGLRYLTSAGYKVRIGRSLPGQPDIIFPGKRVVVFLDGCFWHGCPECGGVPEQVSDFWKDKIRGNVDRDRRVTAKLQAQGWRIIRVPEHAVRTKRLREETTTALASALKQGEMPASTWSQKA